MSAVSSQPSWEHAVDDVLFDSRSKLGKGERSEVFAGEWLGAGVAVKMLDTPTSVSSEEQEKYRRQIPSHCERLKQLRHPHVVQFFGFSKSLFIRGYSALVMERLETTLGRRFKTERPRLSMVQELRCLSDSAAGLSYLHKQGVVHRGLTSSNVLLTGAGRAKLADPTMEWTLNRIRSLSESQRAPHERTTALLYLSPEALCGDLDYGTPMDVFAFGVLATAVILRREPGQELFNVPRVELSSEGLQRTVSEIERRQVYLTEVKAAGHCLYSLILECLRNRPGDRPTSVALHGELLSYLCTASIPGAGHMQVCTCMLYRKLFCHAHAEGFLSFLQ